MTRRARLVTLLVGAATAALTWKLFGTRPSQVRPEAALAGYETRDASAAGLFAALGIFATCIATSIGLMILLIGLWHRADAARETHFTQTQRMQQQPPEPRLQVEPFDDLARNRGSEASLIDGYARLGATTARIPVSRAMALVVGRSLDYRK